MITEMSLVNITGPRDDIDRMSDQYLTKYEIHLENTLQELSGIETLRPYTSTDPYQPYIEQIHTLLALTNINDVDSQVIHKPYTFERAKELVESIEHNLSIDRENLAQAEQQLTDFQAKYELFQPFTNLDYDFGRILSMDHIKFRFGRFTEENYEKFKKYIDQMVPSIFEYATTQEGYVYGVYFTPTEARQRVDALYYSLAWERLRLPTTEGDFATIVSDLDKEITQLVTEKTVIQDRLRAQITPLAPDLITAKNRLEDLSKAFYIRKYAAITRDEFAKKETRYLVIGWMAKDDAQAFKEAVKNDGNVTMYIESDEDTKTMNAPTKMKNNLFVRPFEMLTRMYGVPNYREFDPTWIVAASYSLLFGAMFGDVGQGLVIALIGLVGVFKPKLRAITMLIPIGICSTIFGALYGSIFGFEDVIPALWLHPMTHMTELNFFGSLNTVFVVAVAFGMFLIIMTMCLNIYQQIKNGNTLEAIFDKNGIAGLVFYGIIVFMLVLYFAGQAIPATIIFVILLLISLLMIAFKEKIIAWIEHTKPEEGEKEGIVMTLLTTFFETFETLLTYFSNSISFVRVGAFAISHAAMMSVVLMFSGAETGDINWIVIILGNLFVAGFEGMIVAIQVLRLEFYEIFSHFYAGDGIEFSNIWNKNK